MTGLELLKSSETTAGEIADIVSRPCPPIAPTECDRISCRFCWLRWLTEEQTGKETGPSDKQTAPCEGCPLAGKAKELLHLGKMFEEIDRAVNADFPGHTSQ